ncbi:MAG: inositol monophosphatase [Lachnospiraceae bacterium]|nr:inositol monophosphatase [Lachnospiraceae bacterium]
MFKDFDKIELLARECGEIIKNADRYNADTMQKEGHANFVTEYDIKVQAKLKKGLLELLPCAGFFGEEGENDRFPDDEYVFVVDPIDGTTNFMKGFNMSAIAISLLKDMDRLFGLVYNPFSDEMFTAVKGEGANLNGKKIRVSNEPLERGVVLFGTSPYYPDLIKSAFDKAYSFMDKCIDVRRMGSAELDLCYVACGRAELYFEPFIQPWDYAAGSLIVEEAGGRVSKWDGSEFDITKGCSCLAYGSGLGRMILV